MAENSRSAQAQLNSLFQSLMEAQIGFDLWDGLRTARTDPETVRAMQPFAAFFTGSENALFDSFIVLLYAFYETRDDSINVYSALHAIGSQLTQEQTEAFKDRAKALKPLWIKIGILRNEVVGHLSSERTPADSYAKAAITPEQIESLLAESKTLLGDISHAAFCMQMIFNVRCRPHLERLLAELKRKKN